jgi:hypothetical protein
MAEKVPERIWANHCWNADDGYWKPAPFTPIAGEATEFIRARGER